MSSVLRVIENTGLDLGQTERYAAILGESPSKGAKSPALWNRAFSGLHLSGMMHPMDVRPERLPEVVRELRHDERFIGGAVTMPFKMMIAPYLDALEPETEMIAAVNCVYRSDGRLIGTNTDGAGALWSLEQHLGATLKGKTVLLLGTGGAGYPTAAYLAAQLGSRGILILGNRSRGARDTLAGRLRSQCAVKTADWPPPPETVNGVDVLVNCSSVGFENVRTDDGGAYSLKFYSPLGPVDDSLRTPPAEDAERRYLQIALHAIGVNVARSLEVLAAMDEAFVFDIIYQPTRTVLLCLAGLMGFKTLNGAAMNLEQAVIAFDKATVAAGMRATNRKEVRELMNAAQ